MQEQLRMERVEMAMAILVGKKKKAISREEVTPPPPIPATVHAAIMKLKTKMPVTSIQL